MSKRTPPKIIFGGDNPYDVHDAKLSSSATAHESSSVTAHEISNKNVEEKIDRMALFLREHQGMKLNLPKEYHRYFDLIFYHEGQEDEKFM